MRTSLRKPEPSITLPRHAAPGRCALRLAVAALMLAWTGPAVAQAPLAEPGIEWPSLAEVLRVLTLGDYNTRLVVLSSATLGLAAGVVGTFLLLRKRSLMGDALSHATLPGIALAFMAMVAAGGSGKALPGLLAGAAAFGVLGVGAMLLIRATTRLKDDTAMGIVLSVFFGLGVALLGLVQAMPSGSAAGLESFIYGKTASMVLADAKLIALVAGAVVLVCAALFKEFALLCFDDTYAAAQGWPVTLLDVLMLVLVTAVTVIGLQAVGLILVIALLIIPPAAARFWTDHMRGVVVLAGALGALGCWVGASLSALLPKLPAGAVIVVVCAAGFAVSMAVGVRRGVIPRWWRQRQLAEQIGRQNLLRALYELLEDRAAPDAAPGTAPPAAPASADAVPLHAIADARSWSRRRLRRWLRLAEREELVRRPTPDAVELTAAGRRAAARIVRNHRLWEMYLITHADIAPSHVDRGADLIEHVLGAEMVERLESLLHAQAAAIPDSPHALGQPHPEPRP